jgi:AAHS family 4-hydroxybenzoate transporter-like MFS transporter
MRGVSGIALLVLALVVEGFDLQAANFAAPDLVASFGVARTALGPLLSASLAGLFVGAVLLAPLGDRFGRKTVIVAAGLGYGAFSLACALSPSLPWLFAARFVVGIGLGAVLPNALVLAGELAPPKLAASAAGLAGVGITLGGVLAGLVSAQLLPSFGWRSLFVVGGILPLFVFLALIIWLPESPQLDRRDSFARASARTVIWDLIRPPLLATTICIWGLFALVLMTVYLLGGWIPLLMSDAGLSQRDGAYVAAGYHLGGAVGAICAAALLRSMRWSVVSLFAFLGVAALAALASGAPAGAALTTLVVAAGFCVTGAQNAANGSASSTYPTPIRAAGLGWALGFGRFGSVMGPLVGSWAVLLGFEHPNQFFTVAIGPMAVAGVIALWLRRAGASPDVSRSR